MEWAPVNGAIPEGITVRITATPVIGLPIREIQRVRRWYSRNGNVCDESVQVHHSGFRAVNRVQQVPLFIRASRGFMRIPVPLPAGGSRA